MVPIDPQSSRADRPIPAWEEAPLSPPVVPDPLPGDGARPGRARLEADAAGRGASRGSLSRIPRSRRASLATPRSRSTC